jgi:RNA polymerase sigma factor (TIGR02999 family)
MPTVTELLQALHGGQKEAVDALFPLVYQELRNLAIRNLAQEKPGQTLQPTALVHEAYLRLIPPSGQDHSGPLATANRRYFFAAAAEAMRRILIDQARRKRALKHGGGRIHVDFPPDLPSLSPDNAALDDLSLALDSLAESHPDHAELVKLRFYLGMSADQAAEILGISPSSADRRWVFARAWLRRELEKLNPS